MDDIEEKFDSFFKYLNRESVYEGGLSTLFSDVTQELIFKRPLERKHNKDAPIPRNYLSQYITPFIDYMFRDITSKTKKNILRKCYVFDKAFQDTSQGMKQIFYDRVPTWANKDGVKFFIEKEKSAGKFEECIKYVRKHSDKGSIVLLLGGIGFLSLGLWIESTSSWEVGYPLVFGFVFFIAVVATMLSTRWKLQSWKVEK